MNDKQAAEVVEGLRRLGAGLCPDAQEVVDSAAAGIEGLRAVLKPFAKAWGTHLRTGDADRTVTTVWLADCKHAAEVLK